MKKQFVKKWGKEWVERQETVGRRRRRRVSPHDLLDLAAHPYVRPFNIAFFLFRTRTTP